MLRRLAYRLRGTMPATKARPILIFTAIAMAVPAIAQIQPSAVASVVQTTATTRIEQPATLSSSQDLTFALQAPVAAAISSTAVAVSTARVSTTGVTGAAASGSATPSVRGTSAQTASSAAASTPSAGSLVRGAASTVTAAVPTVAQATFTVAGDSGQAISVTVPQTVDLARTGGVETALLTTTNNLADGPQFLGGTFAGGGTLSFAVGGQVTLASNSSVAAGTYNGLLAVVAQYN